MDETQKNEEQAEWSLLRQQLQNKQYKELRSTFAEMNDVDIARFIETLSPEEAALAFRTLPKEDEMEVFAELDVEVQQHIITTITDKELAVLIDDLWVDDAVDMLEEMPATLVKRVLRNASPETRSLINEFLRYPENSAGSIMTAEYMELRRAMTVEDAIKRIRRTAEDKETVYTCYVTDNTRFLQGVVTVKDLLLADDGQLVEEIMETDIISVKTLEDREYAAKLLAKYSLISLPVVDAEGRLVGIVTVDDALDVMQEEDTEDFEKMAAISPSEKPYLKTSVFALAKNRAPWLLILMVSNMITGVILERYEAVYATMPLLVTFIPMLTGTGGNAGSQSCTMIIRGMSLGEIRLKDLFSVFWKEMRVSLLVGVGLSILNGIRIIITYPDSMMVAIVACLALLASVIIGKTMGGILPMLAKACHIDPAVVAAPLITTIIDALSMVVYFTIAMWILPV